MTNAELIIILRWCGSEDEQHEMCVDESYRCPMWNEDRITDECKAELMTAAADALEAAEKRIAYLEENLMCGINGYRMKDLILFAELCKRNGVKEEDMKQAAWNLELAVRAYHNATIENLRTWEDEKGIYASARYVPNFEKAYAEMAYAEMIGKEQTDAAD